MHGIFLQLSYTKSCSLVCRFFEILRYQKGIVVDLIDRKTGEVITESKEKETHPKKNPPPLRSSDNKDNESPIILSDVELYRIYFVLM